MSTGTDTDAPGVAGDAGDSAAAGLVITKTPSKYRKTVGRGNTQTEEFDVEAFCDLYRPTDEPRWAEVRDFVKLGLRAARPASYPHAHRMTRALTWHALYCIDAGVGLDPEAAMHPDRIDTFAATFLKGRPNAQDYRNDMRRAGRGMTKKAPYRPPLVLKRRPGQTPYAPEKLRQLRRVIETQATEHRRQSGTAMFLLGVGCGLDGRWVTQVAPGDVARTRAGDVIVTVRGAMPRRVPVDPAYADDLARFASMVQTERLVGKASTSANRVSSLTQAIAIPPGAPGLNLTALRNTWLVNQLLRAVPFPHLLDAAGLTTLSSLDFVMPFVAAQLGDPSWHEDLV